MIWGEFAKATGVLVIRTRQLTSEAHKREDVTFLNLISRIAMSLFASLTLGAPAAQASMLTIQPGDTFWKLANQHNTTVPALVAANPSVSSSNLQPGQQLQLPATYVVAQGDTMWRVATAHHVSLGQLVAANPNVNPGNLVVGTVLQLPSAATSTSQSSASTSQSSASTSQSSTSTGQSSASASQSSASNPSTNSSASQSSVDWLAHLIHAEAGGESLEAQIAVGDVVWHRVQSPQYPSTVKGVIFQIDSGHYQFTSVANGAIYNAPDAQNMEAATDVLMNHEDVVPGALVFYNPAMTGAGSWVWNQPTIATIGHLTFAQ